jgi:hypothetical protein
MKLRLIAIALIFAVSFVGYFAFTWWSGRNTPTQPISASGGRDLRISLPTPAHYLQTDPRWADHTIGGSGEYLRNVGCTICSAASALTAIGPAITPGELNQHLKENEGYTSDGWVIWGAISDANHSATVDVVRQATHDLLDSSLESGDYPLIKFWLPGNIPHWAVLVGKDGLEYLALDPLSGNGAKKLTSLTDSIYSVRIVRKRL